MVGGLIIVTFAFCVIALLACWRLIPGWVGESFGMLAGVLSTPFFMEASFAAVGLLIVLGLNIWRRRKEGDEYVTMDIPVSQKSENSGE